MRGGREQAGAAAWAGGCAGAHSTTLRATEYFTIEELRAQTGQPDYCFFHVAFKALVDNALDGAESAKVTIVVADSGVGLPLEIIERILQLQLPHLG